MDEMSLSRYCPHVGSVTRYQNTQSGSRRIPHYGKNFFPALNFSIIYSFVELRLLEPTSKHTHTHTRSFPPTRTHTRAQTRTYTHTLSLLAHFHFHSLSLSLSRHSFKHPTNGHIVQAASTISLIFYLPRAHLFPLGLYNLTHSHQSVRCSLSRFEDVSLAF